MNEINPNLIEVDKLSPEQRAQLLLDLQKTSTPEAPASGEKSPVYRGDAEQAAVKAEVLESPQAAGSSVTPFENPSVASGEEAPNTGKGILNKFFQGNEGFDSVTIGEADAAQAQDEANNLDRAA